MAAEHLILAGGGHSHALVLRMWAMQPQRRPNAWITLVSRHSTALYSGLVPGLIAGLYGRDDGAIDLRQLADRAGVNLVLAEITGLDLAGQRLLLAGRPALRFDWLSLDVGATTALPKSAGSATALAVKPLEPMLAWCDGLEPGQALRVLGSGAAAVEVALALKGRDHQPQLQTKASGLDLGTAAANRLLTRVLGQAGIAMATAATDGAPVATLACTGSRAAAWLAASGLPTGARGRVCTEASLQVVGQPRLFASGDCAVIAADPRPPSGVWAVRAAPVLAANLQRALAGRPLRRWRPQRRALQLLGDGGVAGSPRAIALWGPLALGPSTLLWRWKDRIDRRFMARFTALGAAMTTRGATATGAAMACRGCAAKVGAGPLEAALQQLEGPGLVRDDAAVVGTAADGRLLLQSVDGFPALVNDPWLNGRLTTLHACSDLWACGARLDSAQAVVTLPVVAGPLQSALLHQTLAGVRSVLDPLEAPLLGGHTLEARDAGPGKGLSLMLTVNGTAAAGQLWPKGLLQRGDALILMRPIGTGVLFAAAMAGAARAAWLDRALAVMQQSQATAVAVLAAHGCQACTDITGFGLLGHLGEMVAASPSGMGVQLDGSALRRLALPGALELLAAGHASTLAPANARALALLDGPITLAPPAGAALQQLLIDPQTCGPLLAALPAPRAAAALADLHRAGFAQAAVVGHVV
jgi:selenide,water dikinase